MLSYLSVLIRSMKCASGEVIAFLWEQNEFGTFIVRRLNQLLKLIIQVDPSLILRRSRVPRSQVSGLRSQGSGKGESA